MWEDKNTIINIALSLFIFQTHTHSGSPYNWRLRTHTVFVRVVNNLTTPQAHRQHINMLRKNIRSKTYMYVIPIRGLATPHNTIAHACAIKCIHM